MKSLVLALGILLLPCLASYSSAQRTTRGNLRAVPESTAAAAAAPTGEAIVSPGTETFKITGYDKPLRSRRETFFATYNGQGEAVGIALTITYLDEDGRQLHRRSVSVPCEVPSGETRNLSMPSWDTQQSFYFVRSSVPVRVAQATPYDVKISVDTVYVK
ncbi:MAG: hypothetical protein K2M06_07395 [Muribaculaceae bacterium]|nr:hypothetical protein [Muribaculaceae bacterium]